MTVSVDIPPGLAEEIEEELEKGRYSSQSELIRTAIRHFLDAEHKVDERELSEAAQRAIDRALEEKGVSREELLEGQ